MTNIQRFIELAIEGGWSKSSMPTLHAPGYSEGIAYALLDPSAWRAYWKSRSAKDRGLIGKGQSAVDVANESTIDKAVRQSMREMVECLCDGKTIEDALGEILK